MNTWLDMIIAAAGLAVAAALAVAVAATMWHRRMTARLKEQEQQLAAKSEELRRRNESAAEIETRYRTLFDSVPVAIIISRLDGSLVDVNEAALKLFGYERRAEFMTLNMKSIYVNPAERERRIAATLAQATPKAAEFLMRKRDGTTFSGLAQYQAVRDPSGKVAQIEGFVTDVSEVKRLEAERLKVEQEQRISTRLQSVGALAAGIAHEINTPMQFVSDSVYFLKTAIGELNILWPEMAKVLTASQTAGSTEAVDRIRSSAADMDVDQLVADANQSAERALEGIRRVTKIIRAMREFAHPDNGEHTRVDINHAIETTLTVCKNVYKEIADVQTDFSPLPQIMCQYGEINQALLNIVVNAAHAIESRFKDGPKGLIRVSTALEDGWAVIRIQDNGSGIPESVRARIFDPFFTTKEVGKGTGQGLAIVQSVIVARHQGRISVESEVGKGTTFELRLPVEVQKPETLGVEHEQEA